MYGDQRVGTSFKRIARCEIARNKQMSISLAENNSVTIAQFAISPMEDDRPMSTPLQGSIRLPKKEYLFNILRLLIWCVVRLSERDIPEEEREFVDDLREISRNQQSALEVHMSSIGFPPTQFSGQDYADYPQNVEHDRRI